ncbi:hypothetical protein [Deminuibacter soli]|nr:hypothetical protein [Deminuibacter soli]
MTPENAAWETWTGKQAKSYGFSNVSVKQVTYGPSKGVQAVFTK